MFINRGEDGAVKTDSPPCASRKRWRVRRFLLPAVFMIGIASLSYLLGAGVMFFDLPSSSFLCNAFIGARAWYERMQADSEAPRQDLPTVNPVDNPSKAFDGFTLLMYGGDSHASLINMRGDVVHEWAVPFSSVWPNPHHVKATADSRVSFFGGYLYPNGDLLVVFQGKTDSAWGYGLAKLDKDSKVVWNYAANVHHDVDVADDGTVYLTEHRFVRKKEDLPVGMESIPTPCLVDYLVLLSPDGQKRSEISILEAMRDSPYAALLSVLDTPQRKGRVLSRPDEDKRKRDVLHANFVKVLSKELAPSFPMFKAGQVLISMRHLDTIAVLDTDTRSVVWAAHGPWRGQHDAQFLGNGRLLIFDNFGSPKTSRVLEYDPQTQAFPWSYPTDSSRRFTCCERGMSQRLLNGNTLVVNSEYGQIVEVTKSQEPVWSCSCHAFIQSARRYSPDQVRFLRRNERARP
jgi:hypothetical protein